MENVTLECSKSIRRFHPVKFVCLLVAASILFITFGQFAVAAPAQPFAINVSGAVRSMVDGSPIAGATVSMPEIGVTLTADFSGNLPSRSITLAAGTENVRAEIQAPGYRSEESVIRVFPGAGIRFTPQLVATSNTSKTIVSYQAAKSGATAGSYSAAGATQSASSSSMPSTIRVYRVRTDTVDVVDFNFYCKHVVPSEWYASWPMESLKAAAMAVKTYAWYWVIQGGSPSGLSASALAHGADVRDDVYDQTYNPNYSYYTTDNAVDATWGYKMTRDGAIFQAHYCSGSYGPGYGSDIMGAHPGWLTQYGTQYWGDRGMDWQWMLHYYYGPTLGYFSTDIVISPINQAKKAYSDFNGDGVSDALAAYNYGGAKTGLWTFISNSLGPWWLSQPGGFDAARVRSWVTGDFNGDGRADAAALYDYGGTTSRIFLFTSNGSSFSDATQAFYSTGWSTSRTKLVAGDFDGDGRSEICAFYDYGSDTMRVFLFDGTGGTLSPREVHFTGGWNSARSTLVAGDFNGDGVTDVAAAYNYGGTSTGIWVFPFASGGSMRAPYRAFFSSQWYYGNATYLSSNVNGDRFADIVAPYNYGGTTMGIWTFTSNGSQFSPSRSFLSSDWNYARSAWVSGDYTGDGKGDLLGLYDYGGSTMAAWLFPSTGAGIGTSRMVYRTTAWNNAAAKWIR